MFAPLLHPPWPLCSSDPPGMLLPTTFVLADLPICIVRPSLITILILLLILMDMTAWLLQLRRELKTNILRHI